MPRTRGSSTSHLQSIDATVLVILLPDSQRLESVTFVESLRHKVIHPYLQQHRRYGPPVRLVEQRFEQHRAQAASLVGGADADGLYEALVAECGQSGVPDQLGVVDH